MSVRLMTRVWELGLEHPEQAVLLALADHANDAGEQLFPSQRFIAWKTGYSERQVRRVMKKLLESGALVQLEKANQWRSASYRLTLDGLPLKAPYERTGQDGRSTSAAKHRPSVAAAGQEAPAIHDQAPATQGRSTGQGESEHRPQLRPPNHQNHQNQGEPKTLALPDGFADFWTVYPRKAGKLDAQKSWGKALKQERAEVIIRGAAQYRDDPNRNPQYTAHPSTWLNQGRWMDDPLPDRSNGKGVTAQEMAQRAMSNRHDESGPTGVSGFIGAAMAAVGGQDEEVGSRGVGGNDSRGLPEPGDA